MTEWIGNWILCSSHKQKHVPTGHLIIITFFFGGGGGLTERGKKKGKGRSCGCVSLLEVEKERECAGMTEGEFSPG